jgi:2-polyprenyl-6-methoxyphenol hydroxylase-like FAD-dependent oxidoreductase
VAHQLFLPAGPLAILPLTGNRCSIVWSEAEAQAKAINALPPRQRAALELCALRDHTNIEAADILSVSIEALESLLSRARRTLKLALAAERDDLLDGFASGQGDQT